MKKLVVVAIMLSAACIQGMENEKNWSITVGNTKINLYQGNILDSNDGKKADVIVVKKYEKPKETDPNQLARNRFLLINKDKLVEVKAPYVSVSTSLDVFYERYTPGYKLYHAKLFNRDGSHSVDEVVGEALKDLNLCYTDVFTKAILEKNEKVARSIALPALTVGSYKSHFPDSNNLESKAAQRTITTILEFIKNSPNAYDRIELFVEKQSEFALYKELLEKKCC